jgi:hypothetical protein
MTECIACHQDLSNASWLATVFGDSAASQASGEGWLNGRHANNERPDAFGNMIGFPAYSDAWFTQPCQSCHDPIGEGTLITQYYADTGAATIGGVDRPVVGCETCHGSGLDHYGSGPMEFPIPGPDRCMACHELLDVDGVSKISASMHDVAGVNSVITDTHYAEPGDFSGSRGVNVANVAGYVIDFADQRGCSVCHFLHSADISKNQQWASSGHADTSAAGPWAHYNWSATNRQACQRCHTTTGYIALASAVTSGTLYTPPLADDPNFKPEMLLCKACHLPGGSELRPQGEFSLTAPYSTPADRIAAVPDLGGSNICLSCHSGRASGQAIKDKVYPDDIFGNNFGGFNSHYLAAAGIQFRTIGYEYDGVDYSTPAFGHHLIGTGAIAGTGTNGPCVGCHVRGGESHHFSPVKKDAGTGLVIDITSFTETCSVCHTSEPGLIDDINTVDAGYEAAIDELKTQLDNQGVYFVGAYPYFYNTPTPGAPSTWYNTWPDKDTLGAHAQAHPGRLRP